MNKTKNYLKVAGLSALMSLLPSKFTPAIAQNLKQNSEEKKFDDVVKKYMNDYDSKTAEFLKGKTFDNLGHCIDGAGLISDEQDAQIEQLIKDFYAKDSIEVVFITNNHIKNGFAEEFAVEYGNARGVGDNKNYSNGLVIMQNPKDHVLGIGVGINNQFVLTTGEMKNRTLGAGKPYFKKGDEVGAVNAMLQEIDSLLTKNDKKEISSDKEKGVRELTEQEQKERDQLVRNIFYVILGLGATAGLGIVTNLSKDKYDKYVNYYNSMTRGYSKIGKISELDIQTQAIIEKLSQDEKYKNLVDEMGYFRTVAKESLANIYNIGGSGIYNKSWEDFLLKNGTKTINNKIANAESAKFSFDSWVKDIEKNLGAILDINDKINKTKLIRGNISNIKVQDMETTYLADKYIKEGFIIGKLDKSINDKSAQIDSIFEQLKNEEYYRSIQVLDESILAFENISNLNKVQVENYKSLKLGMKYYEDKDKYIINNALDISVYNEFDVTYKAILFICPYEVVRAFDPSYIKTSVDLQAKTANRINSIYDTKDLEKLVNAINMYIENKKDIIKNRDDLIILLNSQIKSKNDSKSKMKSIKKIDKIYYYEDELKKLNEKYENLLSRISGDKNDWISLYKELVQFDNVYSNLKSKADKKEENDNKPVSTYKSNTSDNDTNNIRGSNNNSKSDDNNWGSGGGGFEIGGGGDTNY